ncbi:NAD kinase [Capnocytophaga stomatis]|uniref:NAD kinase n=1 Tax=Capnocytophaga stomatis TaxID=1848904 RepID=A0A250FX01_9FLAO|nr:NAD kinase [Capnocytophaga stomatis]ATA89531.1 NAD kinase [Capnocytophaga stomatis]GIJ94816.1 NAD kinase [Capnocytophaga stomatis]GIM50031.1 NAD kinase [Capnocytophaga stomatis]
MKIAIYAQQYSENYKKVFEDLFAHIEPSDVVYVEQKLFEDLKREAILSNECKSFTCFSDLDASFDVMLTIGGDGTILRAITFVRNLNIPILGINVGRLGFLATAQKDEIENVFSALRTKNYKITERSVIEAIVSSDGKPVSEINFALNEITVTRKNTASMITINTELNGEFLTSYWADGLIISTPTGSTGYSLSCGGPVIIPNAKNFVITPIAPHNLNARPLVIPDDTEIKLTISGREKKYLISFDSRIETLLNKVSVTIRKADFSIKMIRLEGESFINTLRNKLLWGEDSRNKNN